MRERENEREREETERDGEGKAREEIISLSLSLSFFLDHLLFQTSNALSAASRLTISVTDDLRL